MGVRALGGFRVLVRGVGFWGLKSRVCSDFGDSACGLVVFSGCSASDSLANFGGHVLSVCWWLQDFW